MRKKNQNFITEHLALIDAPHCVNQAYASGVTSARTLYELRQAWEAFPERVDAWFRSTSRISRDAIKDALVRFRHDEIMVADVGGRQEVEASTLEFRHDEIPVSPMLRLPSAVPLACPGSEGPGARGRLGATLARPKRPSASGDMIVHYKGQKARIAPGATVAVILDGHDAPVEVPWSEIVF
jgi:ParB family chromosome partitioning protein